jgi:hypothetical protein
MSAEFDQAAAELSRQLDAKLAALGQLDPIIREIYNRADWVNTRTVAMEKRLQQLDSVIRETYNRADWTNSRTIEILDAVKALQK